jgi:hypothetical protein
MFDYMHKIIVNLQSLLKWFPLWLYIHTYTISVNVWYANCNYHVYWCIIFLTIIWVILNTVWLALLQQYSHKCEKVWEKTRPSCGTKQPVHDIMEQRVDGREQQQDHSNDKPCWDFKRAEVPNDGGFLHSITYIQPCPESTN